MWHAFITWLRSLFAKDEPVVETFDGWIKDDPDHRDQIYGETK